MDDEDRNPSSRRSGPSRVGSPLAVPLRVRVSRETATAIAAAAAAVEESDGSWIRGILAQELKLDAADRQPVRRYGGLPEDAAALQALRLKLHELGGLLVQGASSTREAGRIDAHGDFEKTLAEIRAAIAVVKTWQRSG
jgi:hypothetical protein